ncbi:MAG: TonB-dependent hemoglobin/transferrin/lactoferrin family receptor [Porticoccaceae bacterium]
MIKEFPSTGHTRLLPLALAVILANGAMAQDADTAQQATPALDKVTVSSTVMQSTTENTQVIDSQEIERNQARNLDDLLRYTPGVDVDNIGRFGSSGFNIRGLDADRVAITVDGISLAETLDPQSNAPYGYFSGGRGGIDIDSMKAVEIIKGADSITAGSGALGGAVVFVTKDPADYLNAEGNDTHVGIKTGFASANDERMATATLANRTGALETMLLYTLRRGQETEGYHTGSSGNVEGAAREVADPLDYDNDNLLFKLHYHVNDDHRLGLVVERFEGSNELSSLSRVSSSYLTHDSDDKVERDRYGVNWLWKADNALFDELDWRYDYQNSYTLGLTLMTIPSGCPAGAGSPAVSPCLRTEDRDFEQELHKTALHLDKVIAGHSISYGLGWEEKSVDYSHTLTRYVGTTSEVGVGWPTYGNDFVPETKVQAWNLYARDQFSLIEDRLTVNVGVRYDRYDYSPSLDSAQYTDRAGTVADVSFSALSWQLGASWNLTPNHVIWAQSGSGFRAPTVEDMYFAPSTSTATDVASGQQVDLWNTVPNPGLEAEESLNLEIGYRWQGPRHAVGISVYRNEYNDFIDYADYVRNPDVEYQTCSGGTCASVFGDTYRMLANTNKATIEGVEVEGRWLLGQNWSLRAAYSWNEGEDDDGTPLQSIVPPSGVVGIGYTASDDRWSVESSLVYVSSKDASDASTYDSARGSNIPSAYFDGDNDYTVVDLQARYDITPNLRLNAGIYNLFDEEYIRWQRIRFAEEGTAVFRGGVSGDGIRRFTEPGRNYRLTLAYAF